jgi:elongator complex protein 3
MGETSLAAARERDLGSIIEAILAEGTLDERALDRILRRHPKDGRGFFSKREILRAYRAQPERPVPDAEFAERVRTCPTRTLSGITPVTVLTKPFPCPGRCVFCPSDVRMPKSYLSDEPGCQRAEDNRFDPYLQTWNRLEAYRQMGHSTEKIELIVLGGTWSHYPLAYQRWFVARLFDALNDFGAGRDGRAGVKTLAPEAPGETATGSYNARIAPLSRVGASEKASWESVEEAHRRNESAEARCVGLSLETRPDAVTPGEVAQLRRLGATKIQLGLQSLSDEVLTANQRGHDVAASRRAMRLLRAAGFKLQVHWMLNLLGAHPEAEHADFAQLFADADFRPDELKIYPCSLIETAELMTHWRSGAWRPYEPEVLVGLLAEMLVAVPEWCRVTRMIRDIPSPDIVAGNKRTNLREDVEAKIRASGVTLREIRSREIKGVRVSANELTLQKRRYASAVGTDYFLAAETAEGRLAGFLRLTLPAGPTECPDELDCAALIREVHVYGPQVALGDRSSGPAQHQGLGTRLVEWACELASEASHERVSVISAIGTRAWYRRLGFEDGVLYQHRALAGRA